MNMFEENILNDKIILTSAELYSNIDQILLNKLKSKIGNKNIKNGYVDKESILIIERSIGKLISSSLNGNIEYAIKYKADICNPFKGQVISGHVKNISKMGILLENKPLDIIIARQHHENKEIFDKIQINSKLNVEIKGRKFDLNDNKIICIGQIIE